MIPRTVPTWQTNHWQDELADLIRDPRELLQLLDLDPALAGPGDAAQQQFPLRVPRAFVAKMRRGDSRDPLLRQVLPLGEELTASAGYSRDPLLETSSNPHAGLIHKYAGRVLLIVARQCAIHCRYCFRRHFPYQDNSPGRRAWQAALDYIRADTGISEVIYSGGDPLALPDKQLAWLSGEIDAIAHVKRLRIHTRLPVVLPNRIDDGCLRWLSATRLQTVVVLHANHANEIDAEVGAATARLREAGATVLNQTVLLRGVNDSVEALAALSETLFARGILPYYLHLLDKVAGAAHFDIPLPQARALYRQLLGRLPGYLVPRLVREEPNAASKTPIL
ncbi:EF-P beta-lysylation protein EpmB [Exilibacterium tricleocarpae]|uniref:L-lysine 2,3-aminomutase n=1 Tax=Exilibacterium tricleocarpae TaxID=2591008 RepID=A0A545T3P3_9GAMM|nr:EF-P beta-lysylation protein EpmB [Exilibacterium tricleocarpae]TQV71841.1 EF-P beta-lysylation protein EpmB [Exilibacterium tricleocarpae]